MRRAAPTATQIEAEIPIPIPAAITAPSPEELDTFLAATYRRDEDGKHALEAAIYSLRDRSGRASAAIKYAGAAAVTLAAIRGTIASALNSDPFNTYSNYAEVGISVAIAVIGLFARSFKDSADVAEVRLHAAQARASATGFFRVGPAVVGSVVVDLEAQHPERVASDL